MRNLALLLTLALLSLTGCADRDSSLTFTKWKSWHPWTDPIDVTNQMPTDAAKGLRVYIAHDAIPRDNPANADIRERGIHILRVNADDIVIDHRWHAADFAGVSSFAE
jgi:hypothetical protein